MAQSDEPNANQATTAARSPRHRRSYALACAIGLAAIAACAVLFWPKTATKSGTSPQASSNTTGSAAPIVSAKVGVVGDNVISEALRLRLPIPSGWHALPQQSNTDVILEARRSGTLLILVVGEFDPGVSVDGSLINALEDERAQSGLVRDIGHGECQFLEHKCRSVTHTADQGGMQIRSEAMIVTIGSYVLTLTCVGAEAQFDAAVQVCGALLGDVEIGAK